MMIHDDDPLMMELIANHKKRVKKKPSDACMHKWTDTHMQNALKMTKSLVKRCMSDEAIKEKPDEFLQFFEKYLENCIDVFEHPRARVE